MPVAPLDVRAHCASIVSLSSENESFTCVSARFTAGEATGIRMEALPRAVHNIPEERVVEDVLLAPQAVKQLQEPEDVAEAVAFLLGPTGRFATGSPLVLDGGWTAR